MEQAIRGKIGLQESFGSAGGAEESFGGEVTAAHGSFHGGGPAGLRPVTGKIEPRDGGLLLGAPAIDAWLWRERRGGFFDDRGFD